MPAASFRTFHGPIDEPAMSGDGRYITFSSTAFNLVPDDDNWVDGDYTASDVFLWDRITGTTSRVSVSSNGTEANGDSSGATMSRDGRYISYESAATNLVPGDTNGLNDIFVYDRLTATTVMATRGTDGGETNGHSGGASFNADGRYLAFHSAATNLVSDDTNSVTDVFLIDRGQR